MNDRSSGPRKGRGRTGRPPARTSRGDRPGDRTPPAGAGGKAGKPKPAGKPRPAAGEKPDRRHGSGAGRKHGSGGRERPDGRTEEQVRYDGPPLPEDITGDELHRRVKAQLRSLPERLATRVARHLVAAAQLLDTDPETAYQHTLAARARASRIAMVREASGEAAYAAGHYKEALAELKAARRMNGAPAYLPMMADCERALRRPERALAIARDKGVDQLDDAGRAEMTIVEAGARRDLGDLPAALRLLEGSQLRSRSRAGWAARLRYAYADALLEAGRTDQAREWFERAAGVDVDGVTDAAERLAELDGLNVVDLEAESTDPESTGLDSTGSDSTGPDSTRPSDA